MRWPSTDQPGAGAKERAHTGPNSSKHRVVESGAGWVGVGLDDRCPFGTKLGSSLTAQERTWRQCTPSFQQDAAYLAALNGDALLVSGAD